MAKKSTYGSVRRLGSRYGRKVRFKLGYAESLKNQKTCPYCRKEGVKRLALGLFYCKKCSTKFTGRAFAPVMPKKTEVVENG